MSNYNINDDVDVDIYLCVWYLPYLLTTQFSKDPIETQRLSLYL